MTLHLPYTYAWQNPVLRETIYPYRLEKLRDFLLVYEEIDLWARLKNSPVDPALEQEIRQELPGLQAELSTGQAQQKTIQAALSLLVKKLSQIERLPDVRKLVLEIARLEQETARLNIRRALLEGYIQWSLKIAPENDPVRPKRQAELEQVQTQLSDLASQISSLKQNYAEVFLPLKEQEDKLEASADELAERIADLLDRLRGIPLFSTAQPVTPKIAARWALNKYRQQLEGLNQEELLALVMERFQRQPERYPGWLQYMVIHFSGMRYKSAHGSWADPRLLLQKIRADELEEQLNSASEAHLQQLGKEILDTLQNKLVATADEIEKNRLSRWVQKLSVLETTRREVFRIRPDIEPVFVGLLETEQKITDLRQSLTPDGSSPLLAGLETQKGQLILQLGANTVTDLKKRLAAGVYWLRKNLLAYHQEILQAEIAGLSDREVLSEISLRKTRLPHWAWDEVVRRTDLRLLVNDPAWETSSREEQQEKFNNSPANQRWRQMLFEWEKDITAWRAKNASDLSLVVSRAVCNEISEHIQHARGRIPPGGLTAKPVWYLANQETLQGKAFFKQPAQRSDFLTGASLLFLGWVSSRPHAWAIASPLRQVELVMPDGEPLRSGRTDAKGVYQYQIARSEIYRTSKISVEVKPDTPIPPAVIKTRPKKPGELRKGHKTTPGEAVQRAKQAPKKFRKQIQTEWLRWTHEATVVEVAEMIDGSNVLTFETGEIGLNLRPLNRLIQQWDVYLGYIPPAETERPELPRYLECTSLLPQV